MSATEPHEPTDACKWDHCAYHNVDEPVPVDGLPGALTCGECWHYYPSGEALIAADYLGLQEVAAAHPEWAVDPQPRALTDIHVCPLCTHDF